MVEINLLGARVDKPDCAAADVSFMNYDDDKIPGERFTFELRRKADGTWSVEKATRATLILPHGGSVG